MSIHSLTQYSVEDTKEPCIYSIYSILHPWGWSGNFCVVWISNRLLWQRPRHHFIQKWYRDIIRSSRVIFINKKLRIWINSLPQEFRKFRIKFRTSNHRLLVVMGRWTWISLMTGYVLFLILGNILTNSIMFQRVKSVRFT